MSKKSKKARASIVVSDLPDELRATKVKKSFDDKKGHVQRADTKLAMKKITTSGWEFDDDVAKEEDCSEVGYYISETRKARITPEDAEELFLYHNYDHNRAFDQAHATQLSTSMKLAPAIDIAIGPCGKPQIVNGQHTLWAIFMRGVTTSASITVYQCRDESSVARLFSIFDSNKKRSQQQAIDAAIGAGDLITNVPSNKLARWSQCVSVAENGFRRVELREPLSQKLERVHRPEVQEFSTWIESLLSDNRRAKLITQGVGAAFFAMFVSDRQRAAEFIQRYVDGVGLNGDSPILRLREKMIGRPEGEHGPSVCRAHSEMVYSSWRKHCLGEPMQIIRRTNELPECNKWRIYASAHNAEASNGNGNGNGSEDSSPVIAGVKLSSHGGLFVEKVKPKKLAVK